MTDQKLFQSLFDYLDGQLYWKESRRGISKGAAAGTKSTGQYSQVRINRKRYMLHRVIWCLFNGVIPAGMTIDHRDLDKQNNRIENLRLLSQGDNNKASTIQPQRNNSTGIPGVYFDRSRSRYRARIQVAGNTINLGSSNDLPTAVRLREAAEVRYGFTALHNRPR